MLRENAGAGTYPRVRALEQPTLTVLLVSTAEDDHLVLEHIFSHSTWQLHRVRTCAEAAEFLCAHAVSVVICDRDLPDGTWKDLLTLPPALPGESAPAVIVASRAADDYFWAEVLNLGGCDVLAKPFDAKEVSWSVRMAWDDWNLRCRKSRMTEAIAIA